jgi:hypothetical protein
MKRRHILGQLLSGLALLAVCASDGGEGGTDDDGDTTSGRRVTLATSIGPGPLTFTNEEGWSVTVTRALVSVGPMYFFSGEPIESATEARRAPVGVDRGPWPTILREAGSLVVGVAHAHPGHYLEGEARGEVLTATSVDLAAGPIAGPGGDGITGLVRSGRFTWASPARGPFAGDLGSNVVVVEARAERAGEVRFVRLEATQADVLDAEGQPVVDGCVFDPTEVESDGTVTLTIDPGVWLAGCDFADVDEGEEGAPGLVPAGTQPHNAFGRGLKKGGAFHFAFSGR